MHCHVNSIQYLNRFAIDHCRIISLREHNVICENIHSTPSPC